jgi:hypothetical protein
MACDWIPLRIDLIEDPAVISIAAALSMDEFAVVGRLHHLWGWANRQLENGNATGVTELWIDRYVSATGFAQAMLNAGWLHQRNGGVEFPKFDRWNSQGAKRRILTSRRVSNFRNGTSVTKALPEKRKEKKSSASTKRADAPALETKTPKKQTNPNHHPAVEAFCLAWGTRYGTKYPFNAGKDAEAIAWVLGQVENDLEKFKTVVGRFLEDSEDFVSRQRHPLGLLRSQLTRWLVATAMPKKAAALTLADFMAQHAKGTQS